MFRAGIMDVVNMRQIAFLVVVALAVMVPAAFASDECMVERIDLPPDALPALTARQDSETLEYAFLMTWGTKTYAEDGDFDLPKSIAIDTDGNVYVADRGNNRIQKFDGDGNLLTKWGSHGKKDGEFSSPTSIAVDTDGNVYVADGGNNRIQKFDRDGNFLAKWDPCSIGDGEFWGVACIAVDTSGNIYVYDGSYILKIDNSGEILTRWGAYGPDDEEPWKVAGIAINSCNTIYQAGTKRTTSTILDKNQL